MPCADAERDGERRRCRRRFGAVRGRLLPSPASWASPFTLPSARIPWRS